LAGPRVDNQPDSVDNRGSLWTDRPNRDVDLHSDRGPSGPFRRRRGTTRRMSTAPSTAAAPIRLGRPPLPISGPPRRPARRRGAVHDVHTMMTVMTE